jgi:hypothetical protein
MAPLLDLSVQEPYLPLSASREGRLHPWALVALKHKHKRCSLLSPVSPLHPCVVQAMQAVRREERLQQRDDETRATSARAACGRRHMRTASRHRSDVPCDQVDTGKNKGERCACAHERTRIVFPDSGGRSSRNRERRASKPTRSVTFSEGPGGEQGGMSQRVLCAFDQRRERHWTPPNARSRRAVGR